MGKPGGFFKRLKNKQKRLATHRRRGTKGASKEERRLKHNELVDYYAAKREAEELAAISSSSSSESEAASTDSELEARKEEKSLLALRRVLGIADGGRAVKRGRNNSHNGNDNNNGNNSKRKGVENQRDNDLSNVDTTAVNDTVPSDGGDDDWRTFLPQDEEEDEEEELEELEEENSYAIESDGQEVGTEGGSLEGDDAEDVMSMEESEEDEEGEDSGKEDAYEDDEEGDGDQQKFEEEKVQLLPQFHLGTAKFEALQRVVREDDPWFTKYHIDKHGGIDRSPMQLLKQKYHTEYGQIAVSASAHAMEHLIHEPFRVGWQGTASAPQKLDKRPPYMHETLWNKWLDYRAAKSRGPMTAEQRGLLDLLQGYPDVMDCCRSAENAEARREVFLLHALNHWYKARAVMVLHEAFLHEKKRQKRKNSKKKVKGSSAVSSKNLDDSDGEDGEYELRDRGFGKTRLLIMLPMRNIAHEYVTTLIELLRAIPEDCPRLATFDEDFTELAEAMDPTFSRRPRDYQRQFAGNIDDSFCVGLRIEPSRVRVYTHPLNSDMIICSPLGLRRRLERNGDASVSLSSIEVCLIDEAHVLLMQNWQHVMEVLGLLNKRPRDTTYGLSDLRRVYAWALAGQSGRHRQTIISSNVTNAVLLSTFRTFVNNSGRVSLHRREETGVLQQIMVPVRQHFLRFDPGSSVESCDDARFDFFTREVLPTKILPPVSRDVRTIIFVPSYFDYVRIRNYMIREHRDSFAAICEYTSLRQQRKSLGQFTDLERPLLLVTERFYFFRRYFVKHAEIIVFYSPPVFSSFYVSLVGRLVATSPNAFSLTLFCRYDSHELNRLVGTARARQLVEREAEAYSFVTN
ncbi:hypothetical protein, conserved [Trypanosoma brucei gambiense DAL972]|uniref:U3 small nucleolar RNA-associated protein 25 n=1 Tax=Trypanosoma brucei gambiense (strain MHOM/CI/86/DAL972) TaxID=679716 RepID=C9ZT40_TRYB9|nr:hypothetical protein, conserved [Trypanosoma brucei gambiense DAL972]CBH12575.1 hypothetical protein, conserved [Trypanosoma brucei gambiense DAL972]|eukprot:XP_011774855.1 hypothetical protein, conserved [Trypanosoma brucei gambiense DAL972]